MIHLVSLGCAKNLVDSERLFTLALELLKGQATIYVEQADLVLVNTCAFIKDATKEAVATILELKSRLKPKAKLVVLGCLPARYPTLNCSLLPEADLFVPVGRYEDFPVKILSLYQKPHGALPDAKAPRPLEAWGPTNAKFNFEELPRELIGTPPHRSYLKISEGCNHRCSFCTIPKIRGPLKCLSSSSLFKEAQKLVEEGALELTLVAQDLISWKEGAKGIAALATKLSKIDGLKWIRLMYCHPDSIDRELILALKDIPKVLPYLDIPFQHAAPNILAKMGRKKTSPLAKVEMIRKIWPQVALRATLMVGFPGETQEDMDQLISFIHNAQLENLGVFKYSREEGTKAALLPDMVPNKLKTKRRGALMKLQKGISLAKNKQKVGATLEVLVEGHSFENPILIEGRAFFQAPEVDGKIFFNGEQPKVGTMVTAKVIKASYYDLLVTLTS
jgi:ribosomal protein S12 methylthiotransferase RimO